VLNVGKAETDGLGGARPLRAAEKRAMPAAVRRATPLEASLNGDASPGLRSPAKQRKYHWCFAA
jgi:hypothetical protein